MQNSYILLSLLIELGIVDWKYCSFSGLKPINGTSKAFEHINLSSSEMYLLLLINTRLVKPSTRSIINIQYVRNICFITSKLVTQEYFSKVKNLSNKEKLLHYVCILLTTSSTY